MSQKRKDVQLWKSIQEQEALDDWDEIQAMSREELDAWIRAHGGDPEGIRARGKAHAERLLERRAASTADGDAVKAHEAFGAAARLARRKTLLPREELLARLGLAWGQPKVSSAAAALFQKKAEEATSDEELQALLEQLELLLQVEGD